MTSESQLISNHVPVKNEPPICTGKQIFCCATLALGIIITLGGILSLIAGLQPHSLGPLNTLSNLTLPGSGFLLASGIVICSIALAVLRKKQADVKPQSSSPPQAPYGRIDSFINTPKIIPKQTFLELLAQGSIQDLVNSHSNNPALLGDCTLSQEATFEQRKELLDVIRKQPELFSQVVNYYYVKAGQIPLDLMPNISDKEIDILIQVGKNQGGQVMLKFCIGRLILETVFLKRSKNVTHEQAHIVQKTIMEKLRAEQVLITGAKAAAAQTKTYLESEGGHKNIYAKQQYKYFEGDMCDYLVNGEYNQVFPKS